MARKKKDDVTNQITLYKIKEEVILDSAHFDDYVLVLYNNDAKLELSYKLFIKKTSMNTAKWFAVFKNQNLNLSKLKNKPPQTMNTGFIFLVNHNSSVYAYTGGMGFHALQKGYEIEARFGIEIAKKILSQDHLRGLVQKDSGGFLNSLDRVFKSGYHPMSDIDNMHRVLTTLRASKTKKESAIKDEDYEIGLSVKAGDSLNVSGQKNFNELLEFTKRADEIWNRPACDKLQIPELEYIDKKVEKSLISSLELALAQKLTNDPDTESLYLDDMDIGLLSDRIIEYQLWQKSNNYKFISVTDVFKKASELMKNKEACLDDLSISFVTKDGTLEPPHKKMMHYVCGDVEFEGKEYFVISNRWYRANEDYARKVDEFLDGIRCFSLDELKLHKWSRCTNEDEYIYKKKRDKAYTILHKHLIHPTSGYEKIELCDLMFESGENCYWIHVKHASGAALRDLLSQGYVSAQLYQSDPEFKNKVINAIMDGTKQHALSKYDMDRLKSLQDKTLNNIYVIYAIYDHNHIMETNEEVGGVKTSKLLKGTLSLYAKVDLLRRNQDIRALGYNVGIVRIEK